MMVRNDNGRPRAARAAASAVASAVASASASASAPASASADGKRRDSARRSKRPAAVPLATGALGALLDAYTVVAAGALFAGGTLVTASVLARALIVLGALEHSSAAARLVLGPVFLAALPIVVLGVTGQLLGVTARRSLLLRAAESRAAGADRAHPPTAAERLEILTGPHTAFQLLARIGAVAGGIALVFLGAYASQSAPVEPSLAAALVGAALACALAVVALVRMRWDGGARGRWAERLEPLDRTWRDAMPPTPRAARPHGLQGRGLALGPVLILTGGISVSTAVAITGTGPSLRWTVHHAPLAFAATLLILLGGALLLAAIVSLVRMGRMQRRTMATIEAEASDPAAAGSGTGIDDALLDSVLLDPSAALRSARAVASLAWLAVGVGAAIVGNRAGLYGTDAVDAVVPSADSATSSGWALVALGALALGAVAIAAPRVGRADVERRSRLMILTARDPAPPVSRHREFALGTEPFA